MVEIIEKGIFVRVPYKEVCICYSCKSRLEVKEKDIGRSSTLFFLYMPCLQN